MYEQECDTLLKILGDRPDSQMVYIPEFRDQFPGIDDQTLVAVISILLNDGYIKSGKSIISLEGLEQTRVVISPGGRKFLQETSYVEKAKKARDEARLTGIKNWRDRNYILIAVVAYILGIVSTLATEWLKSRILEERKTEKIESSSPKTQKHTVPP